MERGIKDVLERAGLLPAATRARERWIAARAPAAPAIGPDGLPLPPARLRVLVAGHGDPRKFIEDAKSSAEMIRQTVARAGVALEDLDAILDFGCGCGRTARFWASLRGPALHGCDIHPELVTWCSENLPFLEARVSPPDPPAPYADAQFDLVYAISILTHLTEPGMTAWLSELERIVKPDGLLLVTTHGDFFRDGMTQGERARYDSGELVVRHPRVAGMNACATFHPVSYMRDRALSRFELVSSPDDGPRDASLQDVYLVRRPA